MGLKRWSASPGLRRTSRSAGGGYANWSVDLFLPLSSQGRQRYEPFRTDDCRTGGQSLSRTPQNRGGSIVAAHDRTMASPEESWARWQKPILLIEDAGSGTNLIQELYHRDIIGISPEGDKVMRMSAQTAKIEDGALHLPHNAPWPIRSHRQLFLGRGASFLGSRAPLSRSPVV